MRLAEITPPIALGPLDGRYRGAVADLVDHLSEPALNRARIHIEVEWLIQLCEPGTPGAMRTASGDAVVVPGAPELTAEDIAYLRRIPESFGDAQIAELAEIEQRTVHDVKAVEYFIRRRLDDAPRHLPGTRLAEVGELVHFCCTSEDINNLAYALMVQGAVTQVWLPLAHQLVAHLWQMSTEHADLAMLAHTHGQPATPTTLGKELAVMAHRLQRQLHRVSQAEFLGKFNGATGTFGAHVAAVPQTDWVAVNAFFVRRLGLTWNPLTTQIESHDWQSELYADISRFNRILHNIATDLWTYISMGYFTQIPVAGATGSSTMPHKINPIRFENAEANLELSCALLDTLSATLVTSRLQRDLTDSSTQRNIGPAFGHSVLAMDNVMRGLRSLAVDESRLTDDLEANWEVLGEAIQSVMRAASIAGVPGMANPYERLKELTRGHRVTAARLREFIMTLGLPDEETQRLLALSPQTYLGLAPTLARSPSSPGPSSIA